MDAPVVLFTPEKVAAAIVSDNVAMSLAVSFRASAFLHARMVLSEWSVQTFA